PSQGETFDQVCARVEPVLDEILAASAPDDHVALVAHAGVIHASLAVTLGLQFDAMSVSIKTGSATRLTMKNGTWQLMDLSDVPALDPTH
ncbi:MAG: histidine phosphatase family protein, partial [Vulcanimicrobiaceae bacterium]